MRLSHLKELAPICPVCRGAGRECEGLTVARALRERDGFVIEGLLQCRAPECRREYPVIDGVPLLIAAIRAWLGGSLARVTARADLSPEIESVLGDCAGPGSDHDNARRELSTYAWDHWGDLDEAPDPVDPVDPAEPAPGSAMALLRAMLERAGGALEELPEGPVLDLGCATGRTTFGLAERTGRLALGIDLNYPMLRTAQRVLTEGVARYPLRRIGVVYDRREHPAAPPGRMATDFWAADAADLPLADGTAALVASLNVLDCVQNPRDALAELARVLAPGGVALVTTPYDWSPAATPYEQWLGGHSQRGDTKGAGEPVLRALLTPGAHPAAVPGLEIVAEAEDLPWRLRLHDRSTVEYRVHGVVLRKG